MFETVLIANRGEIACRVILTLRRMGIRSVAVYSDADAGARHVKFADAAVRLGRAAAADSYLNIEKIVAAAQASGAKAIHPGYGFLAENAEFAEACEAAGITFVGPGVEALHVMGDKIRAKAQVEAHGVPTVPGRAYPGMTDAQLIEASREVGFPVLIKPSAGGGGKGMHVVGTEAELADAVAAARREAAASFGDDTLFIERYVSTPRHIEVQVLADGHGGVVHLGERECSLQRRHQKVVEEAPSPLLDAETRARIGAAAVETARSVGYRGAGTVEFIVSASRPDDFFFMEMNARLQVEHPVTEMVTGLDLVEWQLRIAAGEPLDFGQGDVVVTGHAVEARIYAEDPSRGFLPTGGRVLVLGEPAGEGVRVDSALIPNLEVSSDYDPMMAKVIAWGENRDAALRRLRAAVSLTTTLGVVNNVEFLGQLMSDPDVIAGDMDTGLIDRLLPRIEFRVLDERQLVAAALLLHDGSGSGSEGPWGRHDGWRLGEHAPSLYRLLSGDTRWSVEVRGSAADATVSVGGGEARAASLVREDGTGRIRIEGVGTSFRWAISADGRVIIGDGGAAWTLVEEQTMTAGAAAAGGVPELRSPMPGTVVAVRAADGDRVAAGDPVVIVEAMKMEHVLRATEAGTVALHVEVGSQVAGDQLVAAIIPDSDAREEAGADAGEKEEAR